ncbi:MAG: UbiX family flavin prenyltransferase [Polyangia bacterium]|nr:UbiX family flavin prenyltransferase [Polyangia bacterium]
MKRLIVAITGASGTRYGRRLLQVLSHQGVGVELIVSRGARLVLEVEEGIRLGEPADPSLLVADLRGPIPGPGGVGAIEGLTGRYAAGGPGLGAGLVTVHDPENLASEIASGSAPVDGMVILPCSMATLGAIASGAGWNLVHRAADVTLKEGRPLLVGPREAPLGLVHLRNMVRLAEAGARILPCMPSFSSRPSSLDELVDGLVMRFLDLLGLRVELAPRWRDPEAR